MGKSKKIVDVSKKSFFTSVGILLFFIIVATVLTYLLPKGNFAVLKDGTIDYSNYIVSDQKGGINVLKAIFSPVLILFADGGIQPIMLSVFLIVIAGVFQAMLDCGGMNAIVTRLVNKFKKRKFLFVAVMSLFFMCLGSFFGLFEETLLMLPMVVTVCASLGYDAVTGFLVCSLSTGVGFSVALTNPFTVVYSAGIIGANVVSGIWYRLLAFLVFYLIVLAFIYLHIKTIKKGDLPLTENASDNLSSEQKVSEGNRKTFISYTIFLTIAFLSIIAVTAIPYTRDLSTPILAIIFLIGGFIAGGASFGMKNTLKSFGRGVLSALPAIAMVFMAFAVRYVLVEGNILDTLTHAITSATRGKSKYVSVLLLFAIILVLEFFISSSTAKAVFVMGVLLGVLKSGGLAISGELLVLIYIFSDGFTNMLFPTSPTLLIGLSMTGQSYSGWLKKSKLFFPIVFIVAIALLMLATAIGY